MPSSWFTWAVVSDAFRYAAYAVRLCMFPLASAVAAPLVLIGLPQGAELLYSLGFAHDREEYGRLMWFLVGFAAWGGANWYTARTHLGRLYPPARPGHVPAHMTTGFALRWRVWCPRLLALLPMLLIALRLDGLACWSALATAVAVFALTTLRRRLWNIEDLPHALHDVLPAATRRALGASIAMSFVLLVGLTVFNVGWARLLGAPALLFLSLASITLFGAIVLVHLPKAFDFPPLVLPVLLLWPLWAWWGVNRNHMVNDHLPGTVPARVPADPRPDAADHFARWLAEHPDGPIYLVAAEGGASRSALWTAHVLGAMDYLSKGQFSQHVFAVSGISGGSVGAAAWVALLAQRIQAAPAGTELPPDFPEGGAACEPDVLHRPGVSLAVQAHCFLRNDVLSTTVGYMLFPDFMQRFLPGPCKACDRSLGLERAWETDWRHHFGSQRFSAPLLDLYQSPGLPAQALDIRLPILLLNTTRARAGRPVLQAPVRITTEEADDLFHAWPEGLGLPLSALVHNSARFPVVSPGGEISRGTAGHWDSVVDGGYFENSGAFALRELLADIQRRQGGEGGTQWRALLQRLQIVYIENDVPSRAQRNGTQPRCDNGRPPVCQEPRIRQEEFLTPLVGLYSVRSARGEASRRALGVFTGAPRFDVRLEGQAVSRFPPSMSWYLNSQSRRVMWASLADEASGAGKTVCDALAPLRLQRYQARHAPTADCRAALNELFRFD